MFTKFPGIYPKLLVNNGIWKLSGNFPNFPGNIPKIPGNFHFCPKFPFLETFREYSRKISENVFSREFTNPTHGGPRPGWVVGAAMGLADFSQGSYEGKKGAAYTRANTVVLLFV
jgi:hypothetical protein